MATEPPTQITSTEKGLGILFGVELDPSSTGNALWNKIDIQDALDNLVTDGKFSSSPGPKAGYTEYTNLSGDQVPSTDVLAVQKFFFVGPNLKGGGKINLGQDGNAFIDSFDNGNVIGGSGSNTVQVADNASHTVKTNGGDDVVALTGTGNSKVYTGAGNDKVIVAVQTDTPIKNVIKTGNGSDTVELSSGNSTNTISTGNGVDRIIIQEDKVGKDTITDFSKKDILQISDRNGDHKVDGSDVLSVKQAGSDTVITLVNGEKVVLKNVDHKHLDQHDDGTFTLN